MKKRIFTLMCLMILTAVLWIQPAFADETDISAGDFSQEATDAYSRKLVLDSVEDQGIAEKVYFAVWSESNGQDDIYWYEASGSGSTYTAYMQYSNHKDAGTYNMHAYIQGKDGQMHFLKSATFQVDSLPSSSVEVTGVDNSKGCFNVRMYVNRPESSIDCVYLAAWSKNDQSNIYWYEAKRQSDGTYLVNGDLKNHQYQLGTYNLHGYIRDKQGVMIMVGATSCTMNISAGQFSADLDAGQYSGKLMLADVRTQGIADKVYFAVWSQTGGQDDIYWYEAAANGSVYSADMMFCNHKNTGTYNMHAYIQGKDGQMHFLKSATFQVDYLPKDSVTVVKTDNTKGIFTVRLYVNRPESSVDCVYLAAWSKNDQSNICWYEAKRQSDGTYLVQGDLKNHQYETGDYRLHGYVRDKQGQMLWVGSADCSMEFSIGSFYAEKSDINYGKRLVLSDVQTQGIASKIYFAVWSKTGGQDDIYWYEASPQGNNYVTDALLYNHKHLGQYYVHAYYQDKNGQMHMIGSLSFTFDAAEMPKEKVEISNVNQEKGTFDVTIYLTRPDNSVGKVYVPVWTKSDQSDIYWYVAARQKNGSYCVTVDAKKHQWNSGRYMVHTYVQTPSGEMQYVNSTYTDMKLEKKIIADTIDAYSVKVTLYGAEANVSSFQFPSWSNENGQDDLVWYDGTKNIDGSWSAIIHSKNHQSAGAYICDVYSTVNNISTCVGRVEFNIAEKSKAAWCWIDGYKRYVDADGNIVDDVSDLVSGPYMIKVYKWSNYLIIFAKDEFGNYTVPVKAMITSCGNNTPTGNFYSPNRYRWLTMIGGSKAQWCTQISGSYLFHSIPYQRQDPTTMYTDSKYNKLGTTQSLGCVRLQAGDAKWIYDNCALGTKICITATESGGPIAKPSFRPIPSWHTWDPTDPTTHYLCEQHGCH